MKPDEHKFTIRECTLCAELGVSESALRKRREHFLAKGLHWEIVKKRVMLSPTGATILRYTLPVTTEPPTAKNAPGTDCDAGPGSLAGLLAAKKPPRAEFKGKLLVWGVPYHNPHLVVCYIPETDPHDPNNLVALVVRTNTNFLRGMEVPGKGRSIVQLKDTAFDLMGDGPRWRGRW